MNPPPPFRCAGFCLFSPASLPYSLSRHILEHLRKLTSHEPVIGIMGKSGAGKSSLCNALFQGEVTPVSDVHAGT
ncbi:GTPase, partial [Escherichia coli]|uniref:GTPase n=1 Tax=Escherichia coli TaxID=562 RepID=UPI0011327F91